MNPPRLYASVNPRTRARVVQLAYSEGVSLSQMTATLIREALEARAVERERLSREFDFPPGLFLRVPASNQGKLT